MTSKPEYIDIHAHVDIDDYDADRSEVLKRARDAGVWMINVGTHFDDSKLCVELAESEAKAAIERGEESGVFAIVGLHPIHTSPLTFTESNPKDPTLLTGIDEYGETFDKDAYRELLRSPRVVGIGECGLDFFRMKGEDDVAGIALKKQTRAFRDQIELAIEFDKPLMIHARDSYKDILRIIDEYLPTSEGKLRGNVHFFAGNVEEAKSFIDRGFTLSFTGVITFTKQYKEVIEMVPLDKIMAETDCPYVTPVPFRGSRNEPIHVRQVVEKIADIKKMDVEEVKKALVNNAFSMFRLDTAK